MSWKGNIFALNYKNEVKKRYFLIRPNLFNRTVIVNNGNKFRKLKISSPLLINNKLGNFLFTKKKPYYLKAKIKKKYKNRKR